MVKQLGYKRAGKIIEQNNALIQSICSAYHVPPAYLKAVLWMELPEINLFDVMADVIVGLNWFRYSHGGRFIMDRHTHNPLKKFDSSTGYSQIFSQVAIEAIIFAKEQGYPSYLGVPDDLSPTSPSNLCTVWSRLHRDRIFNLSCATLNIVHAAFQMTGRIDFENYDTDEIKMIFSRYNGNSHRISAYGERAYAYYSQCLDSKPKQK